MGDTRFAGLGLLLLGALAGCQPRPPSPAELAELAELEQVRREGRELQQSLDKLEVRLLEGRHLVSQGRLLVERHGQASQVACQNLESHWEGISAFERRQHDKTIKQRGAKVAQVAWGAQAP